MMAELDRRGLAFVFACVGRPDKPEQPTILAVGESISHRQAIWMFEAAHDFLHDVEENTIRQTQTA